MAKNVNAVHREGLTTNQRIAASVANLLGSPWAIYLFAILAFISFPQVLKSGDTVVIISWITQTFIQLVALAVLQSKAVIDGKHSEHMANEMYRHMLYVEENDKKLHEKLDILCSKTTRTSRRPTSPAGSKKPIKR